MRYQGGKGKLHNHIGPLILAHAAGRRIMEPFHGGLAMTCALLPAEASDLSQPMHTIIQAVRSGWTPPVLTEDEYNQASKRKLEIDDPVVCWAGQACTWGGKWWGGYARPHPNDPAPIASAVRTILRQIEKTRAVAFHLRSYAETPVERGDVIYCDPPYVDTTQDYPTPPFDTNRFWDWCREQSNAGADVFVSEFKAPTDILVFWERVRERQTRTKVQSTIVERLYHLPAVA